MSLHILTARRTMNTSRPHSPCQLCQALLIFRPNWPSISVTRLMNPFESFQCGKSTALVARHASSGTSQSTAARRQHSSIEGQAACITPNTHDLTKSSDSAVSPQNQRIQVGQIQSPAESSIQGSGTTQASATKHKRSSKADELPSLQDAPGLPEKLGDQPLRLIIVGHNPSDHAWRTGHYYSNPSNWMWRILIATQIAPPHVTGPQHDDCMASEAGVGFTDVGSGIPGTHSAQFDSATFQSWGSGFYSRLAAHLARACDSIGCKCGTCGAPSLVAFSGKRQWSELINTGRKGSKKITKFSVGPQSMRPEGWPLPASTAVWVMTSTSGASPMTTEARMAPWRELSGYLAQISWPRREVCPAASNAHVPAV